MCLQRMYSYVKYERFSAIISFRARSVYPSIAGALFIAVLINKIKIVIVVLS